MVPVVLRTSVCLPQLVRHIHKQSVRVVVLLAPPRHRRNLRMRPRTPRHHHDLRMRLNLGTPRRRCDYLNRRIIGPAHLLPPAILGFLHHLMVPRRHRIPNIRMNLMALRRRRSLGIFPSVRMIPTVRMTMTMIFASIIKLFDLVIFNAPPKFTWPWANILECLSNVSELAFPATRAER